MNVTPRPFEIGLFTFGEITADARTGRSLDPVVRLREFIDLAILADQAGLDVFGVGEHHRPDFAIASPPVVLAAVAQATDRIRLTSTVTVLSTADPVKWSGRHRPALHEVGVYPRPVQPRLPVWVAVGGTPASTRSTPATSATTCPVPPAGRYPANAFEAWAGPRGALVVGSPQEVIEKLLWEHELLGHDRFLAQVGLGGLPFAHTARSIELLPPRCCPSSAARPPGASLMPEATPTSVETSPDTTPTDEAQDPRWLDAAEQRAWRQLVGVVLKLPTELEAQLRRDAGMSHFEYWVSALLSEAPDRTLRLSQLASQANASLSRLSHVVSRLERRGWVTRRPCPDDARATLAVLTDAGWRQVAAAAPGHVATVRQLVFDGFDPDEVDALARLCATILDRIDTPRPPDRPGDHPDDRTDG